MKKLILIGTLVLFSGEAKAFCSYVEAARGLCQQTGVVAPTIAPPQQVIVTPLNNEGMYAPNRQAQGGLYGVHGYAQGGQYSQTQRSVYYEQNR